MNRFALAVVAYTVLVTCQKSQQQKEAYILAASSVVLEFFAKANKVFVGLNFDMIRVIAVVL